MTTGLEPALLDTNVLVYAHDSLRTKHAEARRLCDLGLAGGATLCLAPQNLFEFYAVVTNPERVATPRSAQEALEEVAMIGQVDRMLIPPSDLHDHVFRLAVARSRTWTAVRCPRMPTAKKGPSRSAPVDGRAELVVGYWEI